MLFESTVETINRLGFSECFVYLEVNEFVSRLGLSLSSEESTSKRFIGYLPDIDLEQLISKVLTVEFYHNDYSSKALIKPNGLLKLLKNRVVTELCSVTPLVSLKNKLYSLIGVNINGSPTIAPKVFVDYLNPSLVSVGDGSIIGEGAKLQAHFFNPGTYVIGEIIIGERSVVGSGARLLPGTVIGDNVIVGVDSTVSGYVPSGSNVRPNSFYERF